MPLSYYWCSFCQRKVPETEIVRVPGLMHKFCKSGRVVPAPDEEAQ